MSLAGPIPVRPHRVLIASASPLFREGLRNVYARRWGPSAEVIGTPGTLEDVLIAMDGLEPDLVVVDFDDKAINRAEFLNRFVSGRTPMKVVLVSLNEAKQVVVYDRRRLDAHQAESWLNNPWLEEDLAAQDVAG